MELTSSLIPFLLLTFAVCAVWAQRPYRLSKPQIALPPLWIIVFLTSLLAGLLAKIITPQAIGGIALFCSLAGLACLAKQKSAQRRVAVAATAILALALALHTLPGFNNPVVLMFSVGEETFKQYANFDKGIVGLILLAFMVNRSATLAEFRQVLAQSIPILFLTLIMVFGVGLFIGYVSFSFKVSRETAIFLGINLFGSVIAEEAFFRGLLQDRLTRVLSTFRYGGLISVLSSAALFGAAHAAGGMSYVLMASLAGFGYAYAYHTTKRIEAPILVHITVNAIHFIAFTYPHS